MVHRIAKSRVLARFRHTQQAKTTFRRMLTRLREEKALGGGEGPWQRASLGKPHTAPLTDGVHSVRQQQSPGAAPSCCGGGFGPCVSSADDHHVEVRGPGRRAVTAEPDRRKVLFGEGSRDPAATASDTEHCWRKAASVTRILTLAKGKHLGGKAFKEQPSCYDVTASRLRPASPLIGSLARLSRRSVLECVRVDWCVCTSLLAWRRLLDYPWLEKGTTEDEMAGWHHRLNGHGFGWTPGVGDGQEGLACCGFGVAESDTTERLN